MNKVYIVCKKCGYKDELNKYFIFKLIGGGASIFGFWAWVRFFFAGTGLALPICIALVVGGVAIAAFSDEIANWISSKHDCPYCKSQDWKIDNE